MTLMRVTAVDYTKSDNDELIIQLTGRSENGDRMTIEVFDTIPYFYAMKDEIIDTKIEFSHSDVRDVQFNYESFDGIELGRVDVSLPGNAGGSGPEEDITDYFSDTWESDIPFYRRASIDYGLSGYIRVPNKSKCSIDEIETDVDIQDDEIIEPRLFIADIEVIAKDNVPFDEIADTYDYPITHFGVWDSYADEYVILHLDPEGEVSARQVEKDLETHIDTEWLEDEWELPIKLRAYETESKLINAFIELVRSRQPDIVSGWNFVDFDWDYILNRCEKVGGVNRNRLSDIGYVNGYVTERMVDCLPAFDMLDAYKKMTIPFEGKKRSWSLDYVSKEEFGIGKIPEVSIFWAYENDKELLLAYNIIDVMLCVAIERKRSMHEFFLLIAELSQVQIYDVFSEMRLVDGYIMSRSDKDEVLPTQEEKDIPPNPGGLVLNPSDGVQDNIGVLDLKSLYPSCIITWNISPETIHYYEDEQPSGEYINIPWLPDADHADGGNFTEDDIKFDVMWSDLSKEGIIPKYIKQLFPERERRKSKRNEFEPGTDAYDTWDMKQAAVKVIMNAFYGVMSNNYWRLGMSGLGDAVTSPARYTLWKGKEICESEGLDVMYGDTDSVMIKLADEGEDIDIAIDRGKRLEETLNSQMNECVEASGLRGSHPFLDDELHGNSKHCIVYEFEKLYERFFQAGTKKRYGGRIVWKEGKIVDGEIETTGFENKRSDSAELTGEAQPKVIEMILEGASFERVSEYIRDIISDIQTRQMDPYIYGLPKSLSKQLSEYGNTETAKACRYSNEHLEGDWGQNDDPWLYFIDTTPPMTPGTDAIVLSWDEDLPEGFELDLNKTIERTLESPLKPIIEEAGWKFTELKKGGQTQSASEMNMDGWNTQSDRDDESNNSFNWDTEQTHQKEVVDDEWGW